MIRYLSVAVALKCFSSGPMMRGLYRTMGNKVGNRRRSSSAMPGYYLERVKRIVRLVNEHQIVRDGDRVLELGTGWLHWEALTLRLFWDVEAVLYDVWDNRQLGGLKNYCEQLAPMLERDVALTSTQLRRARALLGSISRVESFDELYRLLGFRYVVEGSGSLAEFDDNAFQVVVSGGVLEHVRREILPTLVGDVYRVLRPNGWAVHSIDTADHLSHYDPSVPKKFYLSVSDSTWTRLFENQIQYINRLQRSDWLALFEANGFELVDEEGSRTNIAGMRLAQPFANMDREDLERTVLRFAFRRS